MKKLIMLAILTCLIIPDSTQAALTLTIDNYTTDELSFTIGGTFDADTIGDQPGWLAIKNDWSNNVGVHTELFSTEPTDTVNTITIGGKVTGTVNAIKKLVIDTTGDLKGDLITKLLVVEEGARFEGNSKTGTSGDTWKPKEPVKTEPEIKK